MQQQWFKKMGWVYIPVHPHWLYPYKKIFFHFLLSCGKEENRILPARSFSEKDWRKYPLLQKGEGIDTDGISFCL